MGRSTTIDISIDDPSISRDHAVITIKQGRVRVKDLGSKNHTFIGDEQLTSETEIQPGTAITFGSVKAVLNRKLRIE